MAKDRFKDLESPFLDEEVLPARLPTEPESLDDTEASQGVAELEAVSDLGEAAGEIDEEADQEAAPEAWSSDREADEADQLIDEAEAAADEVEELAAETGGHVYEDFEGIEELEDTPDELTEVREAFDEESEQPEEWREEEADEEAVAGEDEESLLARGRLEEDGELEEEGVGPQQGRGGPTAATATVIVLLDEPLEADDKYRLVSHDGKYAKTLGAKDAKPLVDGARLLSFTAVDPKKKYRLIHIRSAGAERVTLPTTPFTGLTEAGNRTPQAKNTYVTVPSQVPKTLPDRYRNERAVDPILVATSPVLVDLAAHDPTI